MKRSWYVVDRTCTLFISVPVFVALALGTSCLVTGGTVEEGILAATIIATLTAAWASNAYVDDVSKNYRSALTIFVIWFSTVVWLFDVFTFSFRDYTANWGTPVIAMSVVLCFFVVLAVLASSKRSGSRNRLVVLLTLCALCLRCSSCHLLWYRGEWAYCLYCSDCTVRFASLEIHTRP